MKLANDLGLDLTIDEETGDVFEVSSHTWLARLPLSHLKVPEGGMLTLTGELSFSIAELVTGPPAVWEAAESVEFLTL